MDPLLNETKICSLNWTLCIIWYCSRDSRHWYVHAQGAAASGSQWWRSQIVFQLWLNVYSKNCLEIYTGCLRMCWNFRQYTCRQQLNCKHYPHTLQFWSLNNMVQLSQYFQTTLQNADTSIFCIMAGNSYTICMQMTSVRQYMSISPVRWQLSHVTTVLYLSIVNPGKKLRPSHLHTNSSRGVWSKKYHYMSWYMLWSPLN